ncbi:DgyrCDS5275 [Dimorphilus gyrociliatus]|uniref:DgyrCDS5275 n=1 Tax=Dimorphilus gyrociliatus TaxID=2664684 RepID=A0A7I8VL14_9ANNE|nr:DgyrCDS5275 [Dimorphilus gyrociliatus]
MTGRTIIVTGASSGIGYEVARYLCEGGNDTILACRDENKAKTAIEKIKNANPNALATFMKVDLSDFSSIRKFVEEFRSTGKKLHVLVNNAGILLNKKDLDRQFNGDNIELTMATNFFGPFLLTNLLLEDLKTTGADSGDARIVNVVTRLHDVNNCRKQWNVQPLDFEDILLAKEGAYSGMNAYKNSKACTIMMTYELAKRLEGTGVSVNCVCPGFVPATDISRQQSTTVRLLHRYVIGPVLRVSKQAKSVSQGAAAIYSLVLDEKFKGVSGKYYQNNTEAESSAETQDKEKWETIWKIGGGYSKMDGFEPIEAPIPPPPEEKKKLEENGKEESNEKEEEKEENKEEEKKDVKKEQSDEKKDVEIEEPKKEMEPEDKEKIKSEIIEAKPQEA